MQYPLLATLRAGYSYSKIWPAKAELNSLFLENKVILLTSITTRYLPVLALICCALQYRYLGVEFLVQSIAMMLFLLSIPFQLWFWLGIRAQTPLPPSLATWYQQIKQQMQQSGIAVSPLSQPSQYKDLAALLDKAYQQLDKTFIRQWL